MLSAHRELPVLFGGIAAFLASLCPDILIGARMRKRAQPETQRGLAPFTMGLGPNFVAGETVDVAIETAWGADLGKVMTSGATSALRGEPRAIAGHGRERYVYAPVAGVFSTASHLGVRVTAGQPIARIGDVVLHAPLTGTLRGLTRDGVPVGAGTKVIEIDPRLDNAVFAGIGERPARFAEDSASAPERASRSARPRGTAQRSQRPRLAVLARSMGRFDQPAISLLHAMDPATMLQHQNGISIGQGAAWCGGRLFSHTRSDGLVQRTSSRGFMSFPSAFPTGARSSFGRRSAIAGTLQSLLTALGLWHSSVARLFQPENKRMTEEESVMFELIDLTSGNVINDFADLHEALESIRRVAGIHGQDTVGNLAVMRLQGDGQTLVAMQKSLANLAASMEHATTAT